MEQVDVIEYVRFLANHPDNERFEVEATEGNRLPSIQLINLDGKRIAECVIGKTFSGFAIRKN